MESKRDHVCHRDFTDYCEFMLFHSLWSSAMEQEAEQNVGQATPVEVVTLGDITIEVMPEALTLAYEQWLLANQILVFDFTDNDQEAEE